MSQPPAFTSSQGYSNYQADHPGSALLGSDLDEDFARLKTTTDAIRTNLALIQRDDGALSNSSVHQDALSSAVLALIAADWTPRGLWVTSTGYSIGDLVQQSSTGYVCSTAHTSGTFATDLAAGKWVPLAAQASATPVTPAGNIAATDVQAALEELDDEKQPLDATLTGISGATITTYAKTVLDDTTALAARETLGTGYIVHPVTDHGAAGDGTDDHTALAACITDLVSSGGGTLLIDRNYGLASTLEITDDDIEVLFTGRGKLTALGSSAIKLIYVHGGHTALSAASIASDFARGDLTFTVDDATGLSVGDYFYLSVNSTDPAAYQQDFVSRVAAISSNTVTPTEPMPFAAASSNTCSLYKVTRSRTCTSAMPTWIKGPRRGRTMARAWMMRSSARLTCGARPGLPAAACSSRNSTTATWWRPAFAPAAAAIPPSRPTAQPRPGSSPARTRRRTSGRCSITATGTTRSQSRPTSRARRRRLAVA